MFLKNYKKNIIIFFKNNFICPAIEKKPHMHVMSSKMKILCLVDHSGGN
jgi:hypothetical protein